MEITGNNNRYTSNMDSQYVSSLSGSQPGYNGLTGFKKWECFMLLKYGNSKPFGTGGDYEYLIELPLYPDQVSESIAANWQSQPVLGRSSPIAAYANTDLKNVSFSLDLHRDLLTGSFSHTKSSIESIPASIKNQAAGRQKQSPDGPFATRDWYVNINKMLQMSCYPQYTQAGLIPPTTYFIFGQMILKGFVRSYSTEWKKPIINTFYGWNSVTLNMECYPDFVLSAKDMIQGQYSGNSNAIGTASTQNTYNTRFPNNVGKSNVMTRSDIAGKSNARSLGSIGGQVIDVH